MTDRPIPDETMRRAEEVLDLMCCNVPEAGNVRQASILDIATALHSERERCAKIAERWTPFPEPTSRAARYWLKHIARPAIASAIRGEGA